MHLACRRPARAASALLVVFLAPTLSGCASFGNSQSNSSFGEYRQYMAERAAAEVAEAEVEEQTFEEKARSTLLSTRSRTFRIASSPQESSELTIPSATNLSSKERARSRCPSMVG